MNLGNYETLLGKRVKEEDQPMEDILPMEFTKRLKHGHEFEKLASVNLQ